VADEDPRPTIVDFGIQAAFVVAHRMLRAYWFVRRPHTHGALVAVWNGGEVLMVKNSYRREYTLPGGYVRTGESAAEAGARELAEECGVYIQPERIRQAYNGRLPFEFREDEVTIVEVDVDERPKILVDHREVVWAGFKSPAQLATLPIVPHVRDYLAARDRP
jgi:8-oxo-dGTP pyrophosphatase MutT (NUDIX family)